MPLKNLSILLPGLKWLQGYTAQDAVADLIAGITVGLTVLPQGLAYATLAGLEPQYGLYSSFVGGIVYALLGSCRQVTIGPTALLALMTSRHTGFGLDSGPAYGILLCLISGVVELAMAVLKLGALVDLISLPVTVGFTSATAVIIGTSQLKGLLGLRGGSGSAFINTMSSVFGNLHQVRRGDLTLGLVSISVLLLLRVSISKLQKNRKCISTNSRLPTETEDCQGDGSHKEYTCSTVAQRQHLGCVHRPQCSCGARIQCLGLQPVQEPGELSIHPNGQGEERFTEPGSAQIRDNNSGHE